MGPNWAVKTVTDLRSKRGGQGPQLFTGVEWISSQFKPPHLGKEREWEMGKQRR